MTARGIAGRMSEPEFWGRLYKRLGFTPDEVAMGVRFEDVLARVPGRGHDIDPALVRAVTTPAPSRREGEGA